MENFFFSGRHKWVTVKVIQRNEDTLNVESDVAVEVLRVRQGLKDLPVLLEIRDQQVLPDPQVLMDRLVQSALQDRQGMVLQEIRDLLDRLEPPVLQEPLDRLEPRVLQEEGPPDRLDLRVRLASVVLLDL